MNFHREEWDKKFLFGLGGVSSGLDRNKASMLCIRLGGLTSPDSVLETGITI